MSIAKSQKSLKEWTKQKWKTKSGKPSKETGERYLPEKAIKAMSSSQYAASTKKKRADTKKGKQFSKQPKSAAKISKRYR
tara:strand:+ start:326 stop:565 length:240 start_codon:yes stop_codon:yes gene_type:complete